MNISEHIKKRAKFIHAQIAKELKELIKKEDKALKELIKKEDNKFFRRRILREVKDLFIRPKFRHWIIECGTCDQFHRHDYTGDCRNDSERFTAEQLDKIYGEFGWEIVNDD